MRSVDTLHSSVQIQVRDIRETCSIQGEVRKHDSDRSLCELAEVREGSTGQNLHIGNVGLLHNRLEDGGGYSVGNLMRIVNVSFLVSFELIRERKCLAACFARVLGNITYSLAVLAGQMVLEMVFLHKLFLTMWTLKLSLSLVSQLVLFEASILRECFLTNVTLIGSLIIVEPHVKLQVVLASKYLKS